MEKGVGSVGIRVLAGGALSGDLIRHPLAAQNVVPIATGQTMGEDIDRAADFNVLVLDGYVDNLIEAGLRFAISSDNLSTALVGLSSFEQLEQAVSAVNKGPLPLAAMGKLENIWKTW